MESAYRMQFAALDAFDVRKEPAAIREEYGTGAVRQRLPAGPPPRRARRPLRPRRLQRPGTIIKDLEKNYRKNCPDMDRRPRRR